MLDLVRLEQRVAHLVTHRPQEREAHPAAHDQRVDPRQQRVEHAELVAHLGPTEHGDERAPRRLQQAAQHLHLARQQAPRGARQPRRRPDDRRVRPVGGAEGIVDVEVLTRYELVDERGVVGLLTRVEAQVLEQFDAGG